MPKNSSPAQGRVDSFVVALPLTDSAEDAALEERIAMRLYDVEISSAAVRSRLLEWCEQRCHCLKSPARRLHRDFSRFAQKLNGLTV